MTDRDSAFTELSEEMREAFIDYGWDFRAANESYRQDDLRAAAEDWERFIRGRLDFAAGRDLPDDCVPQTDYALMRGGRILGTGRFRPRLNETLMVSSGHIGYDVRPSERGKGYATTILRRCLEIARAAGLSRVLLTCEKDNVASARVIQKNGGVLENEVISPWTGNLSQRYWIDLEGGRGWKSD